MFIFFLFIFFQTYCYLNNSTKLKHDIKKIQESIATPFNKKIQKETQKLITLCATIKEKESLKKIKKHLEEFKEIDLYKQKIIIEKSLETITKLLDETNSKETSYLLGCVSELLESPELSINLKPFFYKQRARLIDSLEEGLFASSLAKQIHTLQKNLTQELEFCISTLTKDLRYKELVNLQSLYLKEKESKKALMIIEKIITLEHEKIASFYKNKELKKLIYRLDSYLPETTETTRLSLPLNSDTINLIKKYEKTLLLETLDICIL